VALIFTSRQSMKEHLCQTLPAQQSSIAWSPSGLPVLPDRNIPNDGYDTTMTMRTCFSRVMDGLLGGIGVVAASIVPAWHACLEFAGAAQSRSIRNSACPLDVSQGSRAARWRMVTLPPVRRILAAHQLRLLPLNSLRSPPPGVRSGAKVT